MTKLIALLVAIWYGFLGVLLPAAKNPAYRVLGFGTRWVLHVILLALVLVGLFFLNGPLQFPKHLPRPVFLQNFWLPLFGLVLYLILWVGWWLWVLLRTEAGAVEFPDIEAAWLEALQKLADSGVRLTDTPLFLVLGRPEANEDGLFQPGQITLTVKRTPSSLRAPIHVYASRDAVYVTCAGASLLGKHAANMALEGISEAEEAQSPAEEDPMTKTLRPEAEGQKEAIRLMVQAQAAGRQMTARERRAARRALGVASPQLLRNAAEVEALNARLAYLCRLIINDRKPFCPVNGILLLIPLGGSDTEADAQQTADICQRDLGVVRELMQVECPVFALACDLESIPGFSEFVQRVEAKDRQRRIGQRFPLASPDLQSQALRDQIESSIHWSCKKLLNDWVFKLFRVEADPAEKSAAVSGNSKLFLLLNEFRERANNLGRILSQGVAGNPNGRWPFGGCYMAATGLEKDRDQAFVGGVLSRLVESQNFVAWTEQALAEDAKAHRRAGLGYGALAVAVILGVVILAILWFRR